MNKISLNCEGKACSIRLAFALALALTSCGGTKPTTEVSGGGEIVSSRDELQELCDKEYIEANYCGIGWAKSSTKSIATQESGIQARENLAASVQTDINARVKTFGTNNPSGRAQEEAVRRAIADVGKEISDMRTQKVLDIYSIEEKQYIVYTLMTSSRKAVLENARQKLRTSQELTQLQRTLNLNANVESMLEQAPVIP